MKLTPENKKRLDELFRKHHSDVFRLCLRFAAGDRQWALDRAQDVFIKLAHEMARLEELNDLGGWLYRVGANMCLMELRRQKGFRKVMDGLMGIPKPTSTTPERTLRANRDLSDVEKAIHNLPANERALMVLVYLDGKSQTEAAQTLGFSKGYVSKLHRRAMTTLEAQEWEVEHG